MLCTHPMFGPESGKNGWKDLAFMYDKVRVRVEATCSSFLHIFECEVMKSNQIPGINAIYSLQSAYPELRVDDILCWERVAE